MSTCLVVICKDIGEKINCPGDFVIVYMTDFPKFGGNWECDEMSYDDDATTIIDAINRGEGSQSRVLQCKQNKGVQVLLQQGQ